MNMFRSPVRWGAALVLAVGLTIPLMFASTTGAAARSSQGHLRTVSGSSVAGHDSSTGGYSTKRMTVEVVLRPRHAQAMHRALRAVYTRHSGRFHQWLHRGQFSTRFRPTSRAQHSVASYLRAAGMTVRRTSSPFLLRATASSARIESAFHTSLRTYRSAAAPKQDGRSVTHYFANSRPARLPSRLSRHVLSVVGLTDTVRLQSSAVPEPIRPGGHATGTPTSCEAPYPTAQQFFDDVNNGVSFPFGYGGGPGCNGLTPSQVRSLYSAPTAPQSLGRGETMGLFELSAYQPSDIATWAHTFYGSHFQPPLQDVNVDGGPLNVQCPVGDMCPPAFEAYAGDIEVAADIEATLAVAPSVHRLQVYNAPNDFTGQTELDEYTRIAQDDTSSTISSSWGLCENDAGEAYAQAENLIFEQMALQGQSMFNDAGDTGAFDCIRDGTGTAVNVGDPTAQPWVTGVGGTSFSTYNPGTRPNPSYPHSGESVWNTDNLCAAPTVMEGDQTGDFWCTELGAGGGGSSQFWGRPFYQRGPGVNNRDTQRGNGTTQCALASTGTPCREVPDVSANADPYTPYAEYCTGSASTPNSVCGTFSDGQTPPGWFGIGGTSLSSPVWAAIIGDRNGYHGRRTGNANVFLYRHFALTGYRDFHDVTGRGQVAKYNGVYPTRVGYDLATGIGSPEMRNLITGR
jgi:subtilase family serine protease